MKMQTNTGLDYESHCSFGNDEQFVDFSSQVFLIHPIDDGKTELHQA